MSALDKVTAFRSLMIHDLSLQVHLGCTATERENTQEIRVSVELRFLEIPVGEITDNLEDTLCYARICDGFKNHIADKEFSLIEKIGRDFLLIIKEYVGSKAQVALTIHKVAPPVQGLLGGTSYSLSDFI